MKLETASFEFTQDVDSNHNGIINELHVEITDAGGGPYIVLKTDRWSLDVDDLPVFMNELKKLVQQVEEQRSPFEQVIVANQSS